MLARVYRDPWDSFRGASGELAQFFNGREAGMAGPAEWVPSVDIINDREHYEVHADVPGVDPQDIDVSLEGSVLTISGHRKTQTTEESAGYTRTERSYGSFSRSFTLPDTAAAEDISAKIEHGVLKLHIPKKQQVLPKKIKIEG